MFDSSNIAALATHAENECVQTLAETGFLGAGRFMGFILGDAG